MADFIDMLFGMMGGPVLPRKPPPAPGMTDASQGLAGPGANAMTADQFVNPSTLPSRPAPVVRPLFPQHAEPQGLFSAYQGGPEELQAPEHNVEGLLDIKQNPHDLRNRWINSDARRSDNILDWREDTKKHANELMFYEMVRRLREAGMKVDLPSNIPPEYRGNR